MTTEAEEYAIPISQEMEDIGLKILRESGITEVHLECDRLLVQEIFRAMTIQWIKEIKQKFFSAFHFRNCTSETDKE